MFGAEAIFYSPWCFVMVMALPVSDSLTKTSVCQYGGSLPRRTRGSQQNRVVYVAIQCHVADGPILSPELLQHYNFGTYSCNYLAAECQYQLVLSSSAKKNGRHHVEGFFTSNYLHLVGSFIPMMPTLLTKWLVGLGIASPLS
jgi:hypothetical protein